tara:strand:- start:1300 stop:2115 length:816 start_codon:yes stop_codon:yes gene_type:complete
METQKDLLDEDKAIAGQKFCCISFISPEKIIKRKNIYFFEQFLNQWEFSKSLVKYRNFLHFLSYKYNLDFDKVIQDFDEYVKSEKDELSYSNLLDDYKNFLDANEEILLEKFNKENNFQTNVRGIKIRGSFNSLPEAELRCKMLREVDPHHNIGICPVGMWVPMDPEAYKTGRVEYLEEELNKLMHEKQKNEKSAKEQFENRVINAKKTAINKNIELAKKTGNKLTQNLNEDNQLVSTTNISQESNLGENSTLNDIRKELFEGNNIITKKK